MKTCTEYQNELLNYVYDLLEGAERGEIEKHLESCGDCRKALEKANGQRSLLRRAARMPAGGLQFQPPVKESVSARPPHNAARPPQARRLHPLAKIYGFAVAAFLLIGLVGLAYQSYQIRQMRSSCALMNVEGPAFYYPEVSDTYQIETINFQRAPRQTAIGYAVIGPDEKELFRKSEKCEGKLSIKLPETLEVKPRSTLKVWAEESGRKVDQSQVNLPLGTPCTITYLTTDKPMYRPGETVFFRSLSVDGLSLKPRGEFSVKFQVKDPRGGGVSSEESETCLGVGKGSYALPKDAAGGEYTVTVSGLGGQVAGQTRAFLVWHYAPPRLNKDLEFDRKAYGPGGEVRASFSAARAEGGPAAGAELSFTASVDGATIKKWAAVADASGGTTFHFHLPAQIERGDGLLSVSVDDGGSIETLTKTIPIVLKKVKVEFFPEGGNLLVGMRSRVYFRAGTPAGKPAHLEGRIVDSTGRTITTVKTEQAGMGLFDLTPTEIETYDLEVDSPKGIAEKIPMANAPWQGLALSMERSVLQAGEPIRMTIFNINDPAYRQVLLLASCRGYQVGRSELELKLGPNDVTLELADLASGVIRVTLFEVDRSHDRYWDRTLWAERLVYRQSARGLKLAVLPEQPKYSPGQTAGVSFKATDEQGNPAAAVLGVSVVDDAVVHLADDKSPQMPAQFRLLAEIKDGKDLENADFYLGDTEEARRGLDLFLGTHGWRHSGWPLRDRVSLASFDGSFDDSLPNERDTPLAAARASMIYKSNSPEFWRNLGDLEFRHGRIRNNFVKCAVLFLVILPGVFLLTGGILSGALFQIKFVEALVIVIIVGILYAICFPALSRARYSARIAGGPPGMDRAVSDYLAQSIAIEQEDVEHLDLSNIEQIFSTMKNAEDDFSDTRPSPYKEKQPRSDFRETLHWNPLLILDSHGEANIKFDLPDSITTFRVKVDGHTQEGRIGTAFGEVISQMPFYLEPKLPVEVSLGDFIDLPIAVVNETSEELPVGVSMQNSDHLVLEGDAEQALRLPPGQRGRLHFPLHVTDKTGEARIELHALAGQRSDRVERKIRVSPVGFPIHRSVSGSLKGVGIFTLALEDEIVPGTLEASLKLYPSPLATMQEGMESLLQEPYGCFEQTSSINYPNILAIRYMKECNVANPELLRRSRELLERGYNRLVGFRCPGGGYEWFGQDPGHEALTARGLMEFRDMSEIFEVDREMVDQTHAWLMSQRDGQGGFLGSLDHANTFGFASREITDAYIVWALTESGEKGLEKELKVLAERAGASNDSYLLALAANSMLNAEWDIAKSLLERLAQAQAPDGHLEGKARSITGSTGRNLHVETTALAALAWLKQPAFLPQAQKAVEWLIAQRSGGRFGATQATILAMKALVAHANNAKRVSDEKEALVTLSIGGREACRKMLPPGREEALKLAGLESYLVPGENTMELKFEGQQILPYSFEVTYITPRPQFSEGCPIGLETSLSAKELRAGDIVALEVRVTNRAGEAQAMTVAIVGIPAGCEVRPDQLKELKESGTIDFYETRAREVILYWRGMAPEKKLSLRLDLLASIPGRFRSPPSQAYLYYSDDQKAWASPMSLAISRE